MRIPQRACGTRMWARWRGQQIRAVSGRLAPRSQVGCRSKEIYMSIKSFIITAALGAASLVGLGAASANTFQESPRQARDEVRHDRMEDRGDRREIRQDRRELQYDRRFDRRDLGRARRELRHDERGRRW